MATLTITTLQGWLIVLGTILIAIGLFALLDTTREHNLKIFKIPAGMRRFFIGIGFFGFICVLVSAALFLNKRTETKSLEGSNSKISGWTRLGDELNEDDSSHDDKN